MTGDNYPDELLYHPEHDWARIDESDPARPEATLGITWFAQDALGEVVFVEPPAVGTRLTQGEPYAEVESVKAVSDVVAPLSGEIVAVNDALTDSPQAINEDPYGEGWLVRIAPSDPAEREQLMDAQSYSASLGG
jgi:glycine cleavage system H protein